MTFENEEQDPGLSNTTTACIIGDVGLSYPFSSFYIVFAVAQAKTKMSRFCKALTLVYAKLRMPFAYLLPQSGTNYMMIQAFLKLCQQSSPLSTKNSSEPMNSRLFMFLVLRC